MPQIGRYVDLVIYVVSLVGLAVSGALAIWGLASLPTPLGGFATVVANWTLATLVPVGAAFVLRYLQLTYDAPPREFELMRFSGCPLWMRAACHTLMLIGVGLFVLNASLEMLDYLPKTEASAWPSNTPGAFGLVAYSFIIAQLYSVNALSSRAQRRSVSNQRQPEERAQ
jgi:hypothetical protein